MATQYIKTANNCPQDMGQLTLSRMCLMQKPSEPGRVSNTRSNSIQTSASAASGSVSTAPRLSGVSAETPLTPHNGPSTTARTQCKPAISRSDGPLGTPGSKETRLQTD